MTSHEFRRAKWRRVRKDGDDEDELKTIGEPIVGDESSRVDDRVSSRATHDDDDRGVSALLSRYSASFAAAAGGPAFFG